MHNSLQDKVLRVVSYTSIPALKQVEKICALFPEVVCQVVPIGSYENKHNIIPLTSVDADAPFTRKSGDALLSGKADLAVHSTKGLPYPLPAGLEVIALIAASGVKDAMILPIHSVHRRCTAELLPLPTYPFRPPLAIVAKRNNANVKSIFEKKDIRRNYGKVCLVGFGPGDPGLLTINGLNRLQLADIIFYDDLLNKEFLRQFNAEQVYVGKRKNKHSHEQAAINRLLYHAAISGKNVVRLKGGDPMLFAHGGEELEYLHRHFIETEVIPGITTALAAAAVTKIPLTHRGVASSVTFLTGHAEQEITVPSSGTLVYYMGSSNLKSIAVKAIREGWSPDTPVLLVYHVSAPDQQEVYTTLQEAAVQNRPAKTPLIIIIGEVIGLKHNFPGNIARHPIAEITPCKCYNSLIQMKDRLSNYDWLIFTSRHTVKAFFKALYGFGRDARALAAGLRVVSAGKATSSELEKSGVFADLQPASGSPETLIEVLQQNKIVNRKILIPYTGTDSDFLPEKLVGTGNHITIVTVYPNEFSEKYDYETSKVYKHTHFKMPPEVIPDQSKNTIILV